MKDLILNILGLVVLFYTLGPLVACAVWMVMAGDLPDWAIKSLEVIRVVLIVLLWVTATAFGVWLVLQ